jgi:hypothetical protein
LAARLAAQVEGAAPAAPVSDSGGGSESSVKVRQARKAGANLKAAHQKSTYDQGRDKEDGIKEDYRKEDADNQGRGKEDACEEGLEAGRRLSSGIRT